MWVFYQRSVEEVYGFAVVGLEWITWGYANFPLQSGLSIFCFCFNGKHLAAIAVFAYLTFQFDKRKFSNNFFNRILINHT